MAFDFRLGLNRSDLVRRVKIVAVGLMVLDTLLLGAYAFDSVINRDGQFNALADFFRWQSGLGDPDNSAIEFTGHTKLLVAAIILMVLARRRGRWIYGVWSLILTAMVLDDFFQLHERAGLLMTRMTGHWSVLGLNSTAVGELTFWAAAAAPLGIVLLLSFRASDAAGRRDSYLLIASALVLVLFAVGLDAVRAVLDPFIGRVEYFVLHFMETGGEVIGMSLILIASVIILERHSRADAPPSPARPRERESRSDTG